MTLSGALNHVAHAVYCGNIMEGAPKGHGVVVFSCVTGQVGFHFERSVALGTHKPGALFAIFDFDLRLWVFDLDFLEIVGLCLHLWRSCRHVLSLLGGFSRGVLGLGLGLGRLDEA